MLMETAASLGALQDVYTIPYGERTLGESRHTIDGVNIAIASSDTEGGNINIVSGAFHSIAELANRGKVRPESSIGIGHGANYQEGVIIMPARGVEPDSGYRLDITVDTNATIAHNAIL